MTLLVDPSGRGPSLPALTVRGLVALGVVALVSAVLVLQYSGAFRSTFRATAVLFDVGDGVDEGADVKLRGVLVGTVADVTVEPGSRGRRLVGLTLRPEQTAGIPDTVRARVVPTNLLGAPAVELVPTGPQRAPLEPDAVIPADDSVTAVQFQTVLDQLRDLLTAVPPAELAGTLGSLSSALSGRGRQLGTFIERLGDYLGTLNGARGDFSADIALLADTLEGLAVNAPALLDTVDNAVVTAGTLVARQQRLADTLGAGARTAGTLDGFLGDQRNRIVTVARNGRAILGTLAPDAGAIPRSLVALGRASGGLADGLTLGRGAVDLAISLAPFDPYTARDCPRYPGLAGPNCPGSAPTATRPTRPTRPTRSNGPIPGPTPRPGPVVPAPLRPLFGGVSGPVGGPDEAAAVRTALGALGERRDTGAAGVVLLGPIVRGTTVVVPT